MQLYKYKKNNNNNNFRVFQLTVKTTCKGFSKKETELTELESVWEEGKCVPENARGGEKLEK